MSAVLTETSLYLAVGAASAQLTLTNGLTYAISVSTDCWIKLGANPTAVAATTGNTWLSAGQQMLVCANSEIVKLAVIRNTADGHLTATQTL